ncbi:Uncharacterized protein HZ326_16349 [Fusarium oxysporum f. sp. albedinis]|nr:Uncharacterized protein HZ326_16349 [Fusarium oxysporum f. sp. albedinis]
MGWYDLKQASSVRPQQSDVALLLGVQVTRLTTQHLVVWHDRSTVTLYGRRLGEGQYLEQRLAGIEVIQYPTDTAVIWFGQINSKVTNR